MTIRKYLKGYLKVYDDAYDALEEAGMGTEDPQVEAMIVKFLEYCNHEDNTSGYLMERTYIMGYTVNKMPVDPRDPTYTIVSAYCAVDDELNSLCLVGIFEGDTLLHATSEIDTSWGEYYSKAKEA